MSSGQGILVDGVMLSLGDHAFSFDLSIPAGSFAAITGPSGSGKSTLFNLIAGFETPQSGRILIGENDVTRLPPGNRPVSLAFQDNNLFAHLDIFTNVALGISPALRLDAEARGRVSEALARVGLGGFEKRLPGSLSGGERQRAAFARAIVRHRPVILLDEPFAALDPALRHDMGDFLLALHREEGFTVLMITHDRHEAERLAGMAAFIDHGRVVAAAPAAEFFARTEPPALLEFLKR